MLYTKIQPHNFLGSGEKHVVVFFLPYMGMWTILYNGWTFEQIVNIPSTEGPMCNLVKIG